MQKKNKLRVLGILGVLIIILELWYFYNRYETEYINGINPYQKDINKILGVNEPIFNSRSPKKALKPVYGMIIDAYQEKTSELINYIASNYEMNKYNQYIETIKKNQKIMKNIIEFSGENNINYLNINEINEFYNSVQKIIDSNFDMEVIKKENIDIKNVFFNKKFREISKNYIDSIESSTKKYPNLKKDNYYSDCIWNNALMAFSYKGGGGKQINFDTVNVR